MNQPCCPSPSSTWLQPETAAAILPGPDAARLHSVQGPGFEQTSQANPVAAVGPGESASPKLASVPVLPLLHVKVSDICLSCRTHCNDCQQC